MNPLILALEVIMLIDRSLEPSLRVRSSAFLEGNCFGFAPTANF